MALPDIRFAQAARAFRGMFWCFLIAIPSALLGAACDEIEMPSAMTIATTWALGAVDLLLAAATVWFAGRLVGFLGEPEWGKRARAARNLFAASVVASLAATVFAVATAPRTRGASYVVTGIAVVLGLTQLVVWLMAHRRLVQLCLMSARHCQSRRFRLRADKARRGLEVFFLTFVIGMLAAFCLLVLSILVDPVWAVCTMLALTPMAVAGIYYWVRLLLMLHIGSGTLRRTARTGVPKPTTQLQMPAFIPAPPRESPPGGLGPS